MPFILFFPVGIAVFLKIGERNIPYAPPVFCVFDHSSTYSMSDAIACTAYRAQALWSKGIKAKAGCLSTEWERASFSVLRGDLSRLQEAIMTLCATRAIH